jgi:type I restriction enzyme M protein
VQEGVVCYLQVSDFNGVDGEFLFPKATLELNNKTESYLLLKGDLLFAAKRTSNFCTMFNERMDKIAASFSFLIIRIIERGVITPDYRNESNIDELISIALANLEEANCGKMSSEDGNGIFRNTDFNSSNLGDTKDKNTHLKNLLIDFSDSKLNFDPSHLENNDARGDAYVYLTSAFASDTGKKARGFFTTVEVSSLLAKLTKSNSGAWIYDPTCGSGSLLIKAGKEIGNDNFLLYGQKLNDSTWSLAIMNMFLHRFDNATIRWGDSLRSLKLLEGDRLMKFDTMAANPPFSLDKRGTDEAEHDQYNHFGRGVPPRSKGGWVFISHMLEVACEGQGKAGVAVPHGVLFCGASEGKIRQKTIEENLLKVVIGFPANLFFGTGIPAAIVISNKGKKTDNVLFIDASKEFESEKNRK